MTSTELRRYMKARRREIDGQLERHLARGGGRPDSLTRAMRYAVLGSGKRLRPMLALAAAGLIIWSARRREGEQARIMVGAALPVVDLLVLLAVAGAL